jgi:two-component system cell cycle response regulator
MTNISQNILVIEDNPASRDLMEYLLTAFGHSVVVATTGELGIELAATKIPDLILCDIQLPGIDGYEVCKRLKSDIAAKDIPLIAVTAYAMVGDRERLLQAGFNGYISKPINPESFFSQLQPYLEQGRVVESSVGILIAKVSDTVTTPVPDSLGSLLLVDDDLANRELLSETLRSFGFEVMLAESAMLALELAISNRPDAIISDVHMPVIDGFYFLTMVKNDPQLRHIPFILVSASYWGESDKNTALSLGADRYLNLPIDPDKLLQNVKSCLRKVEDLNA